MNGRADDARYWWRRALADLSSTRIQISYFVVLLFGFAVVKTILKIANVTDGVQVINALAIPFGAVLAYHMTGKYLDLKAANGSNGTPPSQPEVRMRSTPEGGLEASVVQADKSGGTR